MHFDPDGTTALFESAARHWASFRTSSAPRRRPEATLLEVEVVY